MARVCVGFRYSGYCHHTDAIWDLVLMLNRRCGSRGPVRAVAEFHVHDGCEGSDWVKLTDPAALLPFLSGQQATLAHMESEVQHAIRDLKKPVSISGT